MLAGAGHAAAADGSAYLAAIKQARAICQTAEAGDQAAAAEAVVALRQGTGESQTEAIGDLEADPPRFRLAAQRLLAVESALGQTASPRDPATAAGELRSILSESRYQANGPSILDRIQAWLLEQLGRLLLFLAGGSGNLGRLIELAIAGAAGVALAVFLARSLWSRRGRGTATASVRGRPGHAVDWFAEADRLAAAGDFPAALRALTSGVATALGGEGAWERSPLTVRELFVRSAQSEPLHRLLVPFEASAYGHRQPDAAVYARAAEVAAPFRAGAPPSPGGSGHPAPGAPYVR
jgi:hypothetical protein